MVSTKKFYLTTQGRVHFEKELLALENYAHSVASKLKRTLRRDNHAENGDLEIAQSEMDFAEQRINEVAYILENSQTIQPPDTRNRVKLGSRVLVACVGAGQTKRRQRFTLVGSLESNPATGKISNESPLGRALLERRVGETVVVQTPNGEINYQIRRIE